MKKVRKLSIKDITKEKPQVLTIEERIAEFKKRIEVDGLEFCTELFEHSTLRLMACKYAYYVENDSFIKDYAYDLDEKGWYVMGRALDLLQEDETSPCIGFDENHPLAEQGKELGLKLLGKKK